jgi:hypothetical protein
MDDEKQLGSVTDEEQLGIVFIDGEHRTVYMPSLLGYMRTPDNLSEDEKVAWLAAYSCRMEYNRFVRCSLAETRSVMELLSNGIERLGDLYG